MILNTKSFAETLKSLLKNSVKKLQFCTSRMNKMLKNEELTKEKYGHELLEIIIDMEKVLFNVRNFYSQYEKIFFVSDEIQILKNEGLSKIKVSCDNGIYHISGPLLCNKDTRARNYAQYVVDLYNTAISEFFKNNPYPQYDAITVVYIHHQHDNPYYIRDNDNIETAKISNIVALNFTDQLNDRGDIFTICYATKLMSPDDGEPFTEIFVMPQKKFLDWAKFNL